jgi:hypothetical protein
MLGVSLTEGKSAASTMKLVPTQFYVSTAAPSAARARRESRASAACQLHLRVRLRGARIIDCAALRRAELLVAEQ